MFFIEPTTDLWVQTGEYEGHVARCARICYKSEKQDENNDKAKTMCDNLWSRNHRSMFRHGTAYFYVPDTAKLPQWIWGVIINSPYIFGASNDNKLWVSTNQQYLKENETVADLLEPYEVSQGKYIETGVSYTPALKGLRLTMVVTTQISTSRELNRTSPNNIAEQSTRYVNFGKKGGIAICKPHWYDGAKWWQRALYRGYCKVSEWTYNILLRSGFKPEDARGVLPLDTATKAAYTYTIQEWEHILDLRLFDTTGKAHPNAKKTAQQIYDIMDEFNKNFIVYGYIF